MGLDVGPAAPPSAKMLSGSKVFISVCGLCGDDWQYPTDRRMDALMSGVWPKECVKWFRADMQRGSMDPPVRHYRSPIKEFKVQDLLRVAQAKANMRPDLTMPLLRQILTETLRSDVDTLKAELVAIALTR